MPELPDLLYIQRYLNDHVIRKNVVDVVVRRPLVLRNIFIEPITSAVPGSRISVVDRIGPFLAFRFNSGLDLILNLMLSGRLQHQLPHEKPIGFLCLSFGLDDGSRLNLCDEREMAKAYLVLRGDYSRIPRFDSQGVDITSPIFTPELFREIIARNNRRQVRVVINDHTELSAIGNAYADEILFEAGIHPKTFCRKLSPEEIDKLYAAIRSVIQWGADEVEKAARPIEVKVRDHLKARNRKGEACPRCGATIRREGVRGYDVFFCPNCQPASRTLFIDWKAHHDSSSAPAGPDGGNPRRG